MAPNGLIALPIIAGIQLTTVAKTAEATMKVMDRGMKKKKKNNKNNKNNKKGNSNHKKSIKVRK